MFFAMIAVDGSYMHSWGSILVQDVIVPFQKQPMTPRRHIRLLRWAITGVAVFAFFFSLLFNQTTYIVMFFAITGAIFLGGAGCVILGGLYWKKGTTPAAWAGMITGSTLGVGGIVIQQVWESLNASLIQLIDNVRGPGADGGLLGSMRDYLATHADKFPINGQFIFFLSMVLASTVYVVVSLLTHKDDFNLDRMLHRGQYAINGDSPASSRRAWTWGSLMGFDREFTLGDKIISGSVFVWSMFWFAVFVVMTLWYLLHPWPLSVWSTYWYINAILMPLLIGVVTTVWFTWGGARDLIRLFRDLPKISRNPLDDGSVVDHHNMGEPEPPGGEHETPSKPDP